MFNECLTTQTVPEEWKEALIVSIYKNKGSDSDPANYRPISLLNTFYKIYAALLQRRLATAHDHQLRQTQYGFREKRSTKDPMFVLRRAQDYSLKTGTPFQLIFLDWKMAFDKVDRESMCIALHRLGVHRHYIGIIRDLYTDQSFDTMGPHGARHRATPHTGIRQGCPLSPYLFIMVMTVLLNDVDTRLRQTGVPTNTWSVGKPTFDLEYADDTLLMAITKTQANDFLQTLQVEATLYGLGLNLDKTQLLKHTLYTDGQLLYADGTVVPEAETCKYLGTMVDWNRPTTTAITHRKTQAHAAYMKLQQYWRSNIPRAEKVKLFHGTIVPSLLYGLDTLTLEVKHLKTIDAWYFQYLRRAMGIKSSYYSHITNKTVWEQAGRPTLPSQTLTSLQLTQLARVIATPPQDPLHNVVFSPGYKDRIRFTKSVRRGHPQRY